jgi:hypothetical protein
MFRDVIVLPMTTTAVTIVMLLMNMKTSAHKDSQVCSYKYNLK